LRTTHYEDSKVYLVKRRDLEGHHRQALDFEFFGTLLHDQKNLVRQIIESLEDWAAAADGTCTGEFVLSCADTTEAYTRTTKPGNKNKFFRRRVLVVM
jgi:hypothetical protein